MFCAQIMQKNQQKMIVLSFKGLLQTFTLSTGSQNKVLNKNITFAIGIKFFLPRK